MIWRPEWFLCNYLWGAPIQWGQIVKLSWKSVSFSFWNSVTFLPSLILYWKSSIISSQLFKCVYTARLPLSNYRFCLHGYGLRQLLIVFFVSSFQSRCFLLPFSQLSICTGSLLPSQWQPFIYLHRSTSTFPNYSLCWQGYSLCHFPHHLFISIWKIVYNHFSSQEEVITMVYDHMQWNYSKFTFVVIQIRKIEETIQSRIF